MYFQKISSSLESTALVLLQSQESKENRKNRKSRKSRKSRKNRKSKAKAYGDTDVQVSSARQILTHPQ